MSATDRPSGYIVSRPVNGRCGFALHDAETLPLWWAKKEHHYPGIRVRPLYGDAWRRLTLNEAVVLYGAGMAS